MKPWRKLEEEVREWNPTESRKQHIRAVRAAAGRKGGKAPHKDYKRGLGAAPDKAKAVSEKGVQARKQMAKWRQRLKQLGVKKGRRKQK